MPAFRKKPVVVAARKFYGTNVSEIIEFTQGQAKTVDERLIIPTLEGDHAVSVGDYVIRGVKGEFYPCKPDIFDSTYEHVCAKCGLPSHNYFVTPDVNDVRAEGVCGECSAVLAAGA